jgi:hypothetical protein
LFIHIDTNQLSNSGATTGSWGRETFTNPFKIEYQVAIEGGPDNIQLNHWTGSAWVYQNFGQHTCTSYNGWSGNPFTEIKIPWNQLGNPTGIALALSVTAESTSQTLRALPPTNPTGTMIAISQFYRIYAPYISGSLPLMGVRTKNILSSDLLPLTSVVIQPVTGARRLSWPAVSGATSYVVYRSTTYGGTYTQLAETSSLIYDDTEALPATVYFYQVTAKGGL